MKHSHYFKDVSHLKLIDVYRVIELWEVKDPCIQHALKKLLVAGKRGAKDEAKDIQEAIDTLERWKAMREEEKQAQSDSCALIQSDLEGWFLASDYWHFVFPQIRYDFMTDDSKVIRAATPDRVRGLRIKYVRPYPGDRK